ncbi:hypothetical protein bcgnr5412_55520 [Bacillus cereus]
MKINNVSKFEFTKFNVIIADPMPMEIVMEGENDYVIVLNNVIVESKDKYNSLARANIEMGLHFYEGKLYYREIDITIGLLFGDSDLLFFEHLTETKEFKELADDIEVIKDWLERKQMIAGTYDIVINDFGEKEFVYNVF